MSPVAIAVLLVAAQRLAELAWSQRNLRLLRRAGAMEHGKAHYPLIVALHVAWLAALLYWVPAQTTPNVALVAIYIALQFVRLWAIVSLGQYWSTRIITIPGAPLVRTGPYRWLKHPIYAVVVCEIALLPLAFGAWRIALGFTLVNLGLLTWRIRVEEAAIAPRR